MIPKMLRDRLVSFIAEHQSLENECEADCCFRAAEDWVLDMEDRDFPREELLIMALAYQAYLGREVVSKRLQRLEAEEEFIVPRAKSTSLKLI